MTIELNDQQGKCIEEIMNWLKSSGFYDKPYFSVNGFAGTGKTTIISYLTNLIKKDLPDYKDIAYLTFTGKASTVLKSKLLENDVKLKINDFIGTIHSFMYKPLLEYDPIEKTTKITGWELKDISLIFQNLIIIDESSMVSEKIFEDLFNNIGLPIILFGDNFQLPPIGGKEPDFRTNPDFMLTKIHRQAEDNPIIYLSKYIRENYRIPYGKFSNKVFKVPWSDNRTKELFHNINFRSSDVYDLCVLSGYNKTRIGLNKLIRKKIGFQDRISLNTGEKLICLQNNKLISNGQSGIVMWAFYKNKLKLWKVDIKIDNFIHQVYCSEKFLNKEVKFDLFEEMKTIKKSLIKKRLINVDLFIPFDYSYCITTHKAQGSEFDRVILFEERLPINDVEFARWLYTSVTRSKDKLFIVGK